MPPPQIFFYKGELVTAAIFVLCRNPSCPPQHAHTLTHSHTHTQNTRKISLLICALISYEKREKFVGFWVELGDGGITGRRMGGVKNEILSQPFCFKRGFFPPLPFFMEGVAVLEGGLF